MLEQRLLAVVASTALLALAGLSQVVSAQSPDFVADRAALIAARRAYTEAMEVANGARIPSVFRNGKRARDVKEAWETALEKAEFPKVTDARGRTWNGYRWHDFRRTTATTLIEAGVPEEVAMKVKGHRTREVFRRY